MHVYSGNHTTFISAAASSSSPAVSFQLPVLTGTGGVALDSMYVFNQSGSMVYFQKSPINCTITAFGAINGYIEGNFNGMLQSVSSGTEVAASGSFKIKRTQ